MKLQVTETSKNILNDDQTSVQNIYAFKNGEVLGKLNYGTVFKAELGKQDKSVKVSLIRVVDENTVETYNSAVLHPSQNTATFTDKSDAITLTLTFKLTN